MVKADDFLRRRSDIRVRDAESSYMIRQPYPITAFEREQMRKMLLIPTFLPIVAAVGVGSIYVDGHVDAPRAITLLEESVIFLNRLAAKKQGPWLWTHGPALCHEIAHLQGYIEHGQELDAAADAVWSKMVELIEL